MPVPKRRTSKSKKNMRRSHDFLTPVQLVSCPNCGEPALPHRACRACGHYRGRRVVETAEV
jgi:large subunit ribosomal protein L32